MVGMRLPEFDHVRLDSADFPDIDPTEYRADAVVNMYLDLVMATLPKVAQRYLEALMRSTTRQPMSDFFRGIYREGVAEGEAKGEAKALLAVLAARGIDVPAELEARVRECGDPETLEGWIQRAVIADSIDEIFADYGKHDEAPGRIPAGGFG
ncbi:hypothetical protein NDR86_01850 [Nocardia sp. CDC141]|uniref:Uncharacterized protein n=1 Tax=Nocardia pulmonis TaxID=2951408 RepID=A0A9X2E3M4_9NOCA|nr:hypothetical protein [Nocardia pulmonis]